MAGPTFPRNKPEPRIKGSAIVLATNVRNERGSVSGAPLTIALTGGIYTALNG